MNNTEASEGMTGCSYTQSGWVVAAVAVGVCVAVRLQLFLAAKLTIENSPTALNRRRIPVVAGQCTPGTAFFKVTVYFNLLEQY
ncbi:hypothetical protein E2C01_000780 [Portunus trituberculatus]|uniref:Uncharacterized protein n=1 Tax=Portunus trituberculatus TaxID=210409 RepID=A0A5B7CKV6_PORTR|nr:hypothetical protein [Portunus trituberculatus]